MAPGDGIRSHIPGALVATGQGWGRAGAPRLAPRSVGTLCCQHPGWWPSLPVWLWSVPLCPPREPHRGQSGVHGGRRGWWGLGVSCLRPGQPYHRGRRSPDTTPPQVLCAGRPCPAWASRGLGRERAAVGRPVGVTLSDRVLAHSDVLTHVCTQPAATCSLAGRRARLSWLQPQKFPRRVCSLLAGAEPLGCRCGGFQTHLCGGWGWSPAQRRGQSPARRRAQRSVQ